MAIKPGFSSSHRAPGKTHQHGVEEEICPLSAMGLFRCACLAAESWQRCPGCSSCCSCARLCRQSRGSFSSLLRCRLGRKMPQFPQMSSKSLGAASSNSSISQQPSPGSFARPSAESNTPANTADETLDGIGARKQCTSGHHRRRLLDLARDTVCVAMPADSIISEGFSKVSSLLERGLEGPALVAKGNLGGNLPSCNNSPAFTGSCYSWDGPGTHTKPGWEGGGGGTGQGELTSFNSSSGGAGRKGWALRYVLLRI